MHSVESQYKHSVHCQSLCLLLGWMLLAVEQGCMQ